MNKPIITLTRKFAFSASHRLHNPALSAEENVSLFGKCNGVNGHGHNYVVYVTLKGPIDTRTGMLMSVADLKEIFLAAVERDMDHKHLNHDVPEFKDLNPTGENVAVVIWNRLEAKLPKGLLCEVRLHETENNVFTYRGEKSAS